MRFPSVRKGPNCLKKTKSIQSIKMVAHPGRMTNEIFCPLPNEQQPAVFSKVLCVLFDFVHLFIYFDQSNRRTTFPLQQERNSSEQARRGYEPGTNSQQSGFSTSACIGEHKKGSKATSQQVFKTT